MAASFSQQLEELLNPQPRFADPEDDADEATKARLVERFSEAEEEEEEEEAGAGVSALRKRNAALLLDADRRYAGRPVSRKQLLREAGGSGEEEEEEVDLEEEEEGSVEDEDVDSMEEEEEEEEEDLKLKAKVTSHTKDSDVTFPEEVDFYKMTEGMDELGVSEDDDDDGEDDDDDDSEDDSAEDDDDKSEDAAPDEHDAVRTFSRARLGEEVERGLAVQNQLALWDQLLEARIRVQRALGTANQLPQPAAAPEFSRRGGAEYGGALRNAHKALKALQRSLLELHDELLLQNPDTRAAASAEEEDAGPKRKLGMADYPDVMAKRFAAFEPYRNATLQRWHDKTRLTTGKGGGGGFGAFDRNVVTQVEQVLMDRERLLRRTQTRRSEYRVLGKTEASSAAPPGEPNAHLKDLDEDIFDDDDFYHQLLRELIERRTSVADPNDQVAMGCQWLAIQRLRSKVKKKVDTKASKGRKVRFHVHSKLVNFMAPVDLSAMSDEARSELYRGLFGRNAAAIGHQDSNRSLQEPAGNAHMS